MDLLSDDLLINIAARVAAHSMYDLFNFQRTNKRHAALCRDPTVSRVVFTDCIPLLTDLDLTLEKLTEYPLLPLFQRREFHIWWHQDYAIRDQEIKDLVTFRNVKSISFRRIFVVFRLLRIFPFEGLSSLQE